MGPFEAFRCSQPAPRVAGQALAGAGAAAAAAGSAPTPPPKRRRSGGSASPAAAPTPQQPAPAGGPPAAGLALEKLGDQPLRLVIVGHNPSDHAWQSGHFYSNPSNWMWRILRDTGIAPPSIAGAADDGHMPAAAGVGFTDVGSGSPGTNSSQFKAADFAAWRPAFYARLADQSRRAGAAIGCTCHACAAPALVAFSGMTQFAQLFLEGPGGGGRRKSAAAAAAAAAEAAVDDPPAAGAPCGSSGGGEGSSGGRLPVLQARRPAAIGTGRQWVLPDGWPLPLSTEVWVMTSTSGAAGLTREARYAPWQALAERLQAEPWPRACVARCGGGGHGDSAASS